MLVRFYVVECFVERKSNIFRMDSLLCGFGPHAGLLDVLKNQYLCRFLTFVNFSC